jgi:hypothetical protein
LSGLLLQFSDELEFGFGEDPHELILDLDHICPPLD